MKSANFFNFVSYRTKRRCPQIEPRLKVDKKPSNYKKEFKASLNDNKEGAKTAVGHFLLC